MLGVRMPKHEVFVPVDYSHDLGDSAFDNIDKGGLEQIAKIISPLFD